ncbi:MAG: heme lyase CcmF/NrfE family subunit [Sphingorhabdus sp.]
MIAEVGLALLWLAASMALLQLLAGAAQFTSRGELLAPLIKAAAAAQGLLCLLSFAALAWLFWTTDLSVYLVAANSHIDKPAIFKLAASWGNHEGSMLLWVTILSLAGGAIALLEKRLDRQTLSAALLAQSLLALGFFAFLLFASNPFERLSPPAAAGAGLNPLLQDLGLAFHPPTLYVGYVGLSVAFSFAVGALITGKTGPHFARAMRPWVLGAWIFLTIGITAGSYWAYYELGWGGWWFWDPVENASLMPWLAATALLHSVSVLATRDALRAWTIMLALVAFAMSMAGTFLVRSGILTSVHAFAVDPQRGAFILGLMLFYVGGAFVLFALRIAHVREGKRFRFVSREGAIIVNNVLLSAILGIVLIGTLYPLLAEAMGDRISVGPPYFNKAIVPVAIAILLALIVGPLLRWRRDEIRRISKPAMVPVGVAAIAAIALIATASDAGFFPIIGLSLAAALAVASFLPLLGRKLSRTPLTVWGMVIAHFGLAVSITGMAAESGFSRETLAALTVGQVHESDTGKVTLNKVMPVAGENWVAIEGEIILTDGSMQATLRPQIRYFSNPVQQTTEAALLTRWGGQVYAVIAPIDGDSERFQLRIWWKPLVTLIWLGGLIVALGGLLALIGRVWRRKRRSANDSNQWAGGY